MSKKDEKRICWLNENQIGQFSDQEKEIAIDVFNSLNQLPAPLKLDLTYTLKNLFLEEFLGLNEYADKNSHVISIISKLNKQDDGIPF